MVTQLAGTSGGRLQRCAFCSKDVEHKRNGRREAASSDDVAKYVRWVPKFALEYLKMTLKGVMEMKSLTRLVRFILPARDENIV